LVGRYRGTPPRRAPPRRLSSGPVLRYPRAESRPGEEFRPDEEWMAATVRGFAVASRDRMHGAAGDPAQPVCGGAGATPRPRGDARRALVRVRLREGGGRLAARLSPPRRRRAGGG